MSKETELRLLLHDGDYQPIPCRDKNPGIVKGWQWQLLGSADADTIKKWSVDFPDVTNTGVLTKNSPVFDVDIEDGQAADAIADLVRSTFAGSGHVLTRFGKRPRRCFLFTVSGTPFKKIKRELVGPDGDIQKIEFLGYGQQFIAFGKHPETRQPYEWENGENPATIRRSALAQIDADGARELVEACAQLLISDHGYHEPAKPEPEIKPRQRGNGRDPDGERYARAALEGEAATLSRVMPGGRNDALNIAAVKSFGFVPQYLTASEVNDALVKACEQNGLIKDDGIRSVMATLRSAYKGADPRTPPPKGPLKRSPPKAPEKPDGKPEGGKLDFDPDEALLAEMNRDNCVVPEGGKTWVLRFEQTERNIQGEVFQYRKPMFFLYADFRHLYRNRVITVGRNSVDVGRWWFEHPSRRQHDGVAFVPAGPPIINDRLNLWRGWGVEPKQGDWSLMREHIFEVLAAGDEEVDRYLLNWSAFAVQCPDRQAETAIAMLGERGSGKGTLGNAMCRIFGQHAQHISSPDHLTGHFNDHLRDCSFLFADEAYGPKDKSAEGVLKRSITEPTLTIEQKGHDVVEQPNFLHVLLASNNEWVVPAGAFERRFVVLRVAESHRQDPKWFVPIYHQLRDGGYAAMFYDLLHRDLTNWHPREIVRTPELVRQQEESLNPFEDWWLELLQTTVLAGADPDDPSVAFSNRFEDKVVEVDDYGGRHSRVVWRDGLYDQARRVSPRLKGVSEHKLGTYLRDHGCVKIRCRRSGSQRRGWQFPSLANCRKAWLERYPGTIWHDPDIEEWTCEEDV
jgi:hypothetical protein